MATTRKSTTKNPNVEKALKGLSLVRKYATNKDDEVSGAWFDIEGGARLKIARLGNTKHAELNRKLREEHKAILEGKDEEKAEEIYSDILIKVMAHTILKDWENVLDEEGNPLEYTTEIGEQYMKDLEEFRTIVFDFAASADNYRLYKEDEAVKNS